MNEDVNDSLKDLQKVMKEWASCMRKRDQLADLRERFLALRKETKLELGAIKEIDAELARLDGEISRLQRAIGVSGS